MKWTVMSYNWSLGKLIVSLHEDDCETSQVKENFLLLHPGENVVAIIEGDVSSRLTTYSLEYPRKKDFTSLAELHIRDRVGR